MQIRCSSCTKTVRIAPDTGALPAACPHCGGGPAPRQLGAYRIDRLIATGGMGEVYAAHHRELGTLVAVKLLPAMPLQAIDGMRERFAREARLTARVSHPGVVRVLDSDVDGDRPFLVLEYVHGRTLRAHAAGRRLPSTEAARLCLRTAEIVASAHRQGVLHRDLKPDNVMLQDDGSVRVLDFGLARAIGDDATLTRTGELVGTPEYMAPEQLLEGPDSVDVRTDVHALGVLLFELASGRSPFRGANVFQTLKLVESLEPRLPDDGATPPALAELLRRTLSKHPDERPQSAEAFAAELLAAVPDAARADQPPAAPTASRPIAAVASMSLLLAVLWLTGVFDRPPPDPTVPDRVTRPLLATVQATIERLEACERRLQSGAWSGALADAKQLLHEDIPGSRQLARKAFAHAHAVWIAAAGLPPWYAACDLSERQRLFGDLLEPGDDSLRELRSVLLGDPDALGRLTDPASRRLLDARALPPPKRARVFAEHARRYALDEPEHWLARLLEHDARGNATERMRAAEMAWLSGAGELAVLLDSALSMPELTTTTRTRLWHRVAAADRQDCPASTLLLLALASRGIYGITFEPEQAASFPAPHRSAAARWFVAQAGAQPRRAFPNLQIAVALGAAPDFATPPWSQCSEVERQTLHQEHDRGR